MRAGYDVAPPHSVAKVMAELSSGAKDMVLAAAGYARLFAALADAFRLSVETAWGPPEHDADFNAGGFQFRLVRCGKLLIAAQPDRGRAAARKSEFHDANLPPRHGYAAFYIWLRHVEKADEIGRAHV